MESTAEAEPAELIDLQCSTVARVRQPAPIHRHSYGAASPLAGADAAAGASQHCGAPVRHRRREMERLTGGASVALPRSAVGQRVQEGLYPGEQHIVQPWDLAAEQREQRNQRHRAHVQRE